jgi:hypothetical protein
MSGKGKGGGRREAMSSESTPKKSSSCKRRSDLDLNKTEFKLSESHRSSSSSSATSASASSTSSQPASKRTKVADSAQRALQPVLAHADSSPAGTDQAKVPDAARGQSVSSQIGTMAERVINRTLQEYKHPLTDRCCAMKCRSILCEEILRDDLLLIAITREMNQDAIHTSCGKVHHKLNQVSEALERLSTAFQDAFKGAHGEAWAYLPNPKQHGLLDNLYYLIRGATWRFPCYEQ